MNSAYFTPPHRIPAGNYFEMAVKLSQLTWGKNTQSSIPFTPEPGDRFQVLLVQHGGKNYRCSNVSINGTTLTFSINGDIAIGLYSLEIIVTRADNKRLRSLQKNKIEIVFSNEEAGIPDDDEFQTHTITLGGAILMIVNGAEFQWDDTPRIGSGAAVTSDGIAQALNALAESVSESSSTSSSVINLNNLLSSTNTYTLTTAIEALAAYESSTGKTYRKSGLVLTYKTDADTWESKQFQGDVEDFEDETQWTDFGSAGGGVEIEVDDELDTESENPVQNKVIAEALEEIQDDVADKRTIVSIVQTETSEESGGTNEITVTTNNDKDEPVESKFYVKNGDAGDSAYQTYLDTLEEGETALTPKEWLASLKGAKGDQGPKGDTVILGDGQNYTLYDVPGDNTDGAMTQAAVTELINGAEVSWSNIAPTSIHALINSNNTRWCFDWFGNIKDGDVLDVSPASGYGIVVMLVTGTNNDQIKKRYTPEGIYLEDDFHLEYNDGDGEKLRINVAKSDNSALIDGEAIANVQISLKRPGPGSDGLVGRIGTLEEKQSKSKSIRVLFIGNSLTQDGVAYTPLLLKNLAPDVNFEFYMWYNGGKTLSEHLAYFNNNTPCEIYSVCKNSTSWTNVNNSKTMAQILSEIEFDVLCVQEYFNYKTTYSNQDKADLQGVLDYVHAHYNGDFKVVTLLHRPKYESAIAMESIYKLTVDSIGWMLENTVIESVIPVGTATYMAFSTDLDQLGDLGHLTPDMTHSQDGLPCMLQAYVIALWVFKQLSLPIGVLGDTTRVTTQIYSSMNVPGPNIGNGLVVGTDAQYWLAQQVATKAFEFGFSAEINFPIKQLCGIHNGSRSVNVTFQQGVWSAYTGELLTSTTRLASNKIKVDGGTITFLMDSGYKYTVHLFDANDNLIANLNTDWVTSYGNEQTLKGLHGYIAFNIQNANGTTISTTDDFGFELSIEEYYTAIGRVVDFKGVYNGAGFFYTGAPISLQKRNYWLRRHNGHEVVFPYNQFQQGMAIFGDFVVYGSSSEGTGGTRAVIRKMSDNSKVKDILLPHGSYGDIHCNVLCFGKTQDANSPLPHLYASQWDSAHACFVYTFNSEYTPSLVQVIVPNIKYPPVEQTEPTEPTDENPTGIPADVIGKGNIDWIVDTDNNRLISIGYTDASANSRFTAANGMMVCIFELPALTDSTVTLTKDDVIDSFKIDEFYVRQDCCYCNGNIFMLCGGSPGEPQSYRKIAVINPASRCVASVIDIKWIEYEPEGIDLYDNSLMIRCMNSSEMYRLYFE